MDSRHNDDESEPIKHHYALVPAVQALTLLALWFLARLFR